MTKSEEWDKKEKELSYPDPKNLTDIDELPKECDHGRKSTEGQCLLCLFGDEYDNPEELT